MIIRRPVLSVGCATNRRVAESNPKSRKRIPFALIHLALVRFFRISARQSSRYWPATLSGGNSVRRSQ